MNKEKFNELLARLNDKRKADGKKPYRKADIAQIIYQYEDTTEDSKTQRLSNVISGKFELKYIQLRLLRKLFGCTLDELFPISNDIDLVVNLQTVKRQRKSNS